MPRFDVDGLGLHAEVGGSGPPLVLLHGFTGSADTWAGLTADLAADYNVIAPNLVGHGRSGAPKDVERYRIARAATDLVALVSQLGHDRAAWLGYSLGGRTALQVVAQHPGAVEALILEGASPGIADPEERAARVRSDEAMANRIERDGVEAFIDTWEQVPLFATQLGLPSETRAAIRATRTANTATGLANSLRGMGAGAQDPLQDRVGAMDVPALLIAGALDTKYVEIARDMARTMPDATMQTIEGAGHAAHLERPEAFRRPLLEFLRRAYPGARAAAKA
ncbi:MAG: 2-succinyl-6-hydroxy-2,4-cyclohexadiene-1-carboxylate synthase [Chloroflexota bacterium]|nr:2-succinyl-6-hydroxy-2,4-cyclohexadiene-1-carboxylate synthase [Chloroflexota bacterium]